MKTKSIRNIFVLALILFTVIGCGRYEDGPWISFRSQEKRLTRKHWNVKLFKSGDLDQTTTWRDDFGWDFYFKSHYDTNLDENAELEVYKNSIRIGFGAWSFNSNHLNNINCIEFWFSMVDQDSTSIGMYPLLSQINTEYQIRRLTTNEMWLQHFDSLGNGYIIQFVN